jgi:hypothetical protein
MSYSYVVARPPDGVRAACPTSVSGKEGTYPMQKRSLLLAAMALGLMGSAAHVVRAEDKEKEEGKEQKVEFKSIPEAVQATLKEEAAGAAITTVDKEEAEGKVVYEADVMIKGKNYEIIVAADGTLLSKKLDQEEEKGGKNAKGEKQEKEEKEEKK